MKVLRFLGLLFFGFCLKANAINQRDTLLVYFSNNESVNQLYCNFIKLKFPEMKVVFIDNKKDFHRYIPEEIYKTRTDLFKLRANAADDYLKAHGVKIDFSAMARESAKRLGLELKDTAKIVEPAYIKQSYYFFDIKSEGKSQTYYVTQGNTQIAKTYNYFEHQLELVNFNGKELKAEKILKLWMNHSNINDTVVKLSELDRASDWINPLQIALYLHEKINGNIFKQKIEKSESPCGVKQTDTIYINQILDMENLYGSLSSHEKDYELHQVKFFRHLHYRDNNTGIAQLAYNKMSKGEHFYFYFYALELNCFYIIDATTMELVYFEKCKPYLQPKKTVKRFSKFNSACKS